MKRVPIDPAALTAGVMERFWAKTRTEGECLVWTGYTTEKGYGKFNIGGRILRAHRVSLVAATGADIPEGLEVDHLCAVRACVRPDHLEAVRHRENLSRGESISGPSLRAEASGVCSQGHDREVFWRLRGDGNGYCRRCRSDRARERQRERYNTDPTYRQRVRDYQSARNRAAS